MRAAEQIDLAGNAVHPRIQNGAGRAEAAIGQQVTLVGKPRSRVRVPVDRERTADVQHRVGAAEQPGGNGRRPALHQRVLADVDGDVAIG